MASLRGGVELRRNHLLMESGQGVLSVSSSEMVKG
jgi:hypothetical protein